MSVEYDLVIIGDTPEALFAATEASRFPARIALVLSENIDNFWLNRHLHQLTSDLSFQLSLTRENTLTTIAVGGVDILTGQAEFVRLPSLALVVGERKLRSRTYLLATGSEPTIPPLEGLQDIKYLTSVSLGQQQNWTTLPDELTLIGDTVNAVELAQLLHQQGKQINLITPFQQLIPQVDREISRTLQVILEAEGIKIYNNSPVSQIRAIEGKQWLQAGDQAIETQQILVIPLSNPRVNGLNLTTIGVTFDQDKIKVNHYLQTDNPRIYACGELITKQSSVQLAQYQAKIAVHNALSLWKSTCKTDTIPWVVFTQPPLARVGITEVDAREIYGAKVDILHNYYHNIALAQIEDKTSGLVKLVVKPNGQILGADLVGFAATEMIGAIATAMTANISLAQFAFKFPYLTLGEILHQISLDWSNQKIKKSPFLATLLTWRRSWFS
jgi:pyruvate/2-oxoglutarate dehydrogenase complex dihydrolipoamide dehydrogenase (E3) component